ncbi:MAG: Arginine utilization regulatory protein RocR [Syntrophorhabdus sp. PtaU1.Bin050]|nr:MAG: Arginine utilization regulatory protein RocR [Syntrophorhabdus sp. PtaU1.Bin050]
MNQENMGIVQTVLGKYKLTPLVASGLRFVLRNPYESFIIVDDKAKIQFMDRGSEKFFGLAQGEAKGHDIREFVPESGLPIAIKTGIAMIGRIFDVKNRKRIGSVYPIIRNGKIIGAVGRLVFHSLEEVEKVNQEINLLKKEIHALREKEQNEYSSKYTFDNILGNSILIKDIVDFAKKISLVDTDVLLMGESGTGKELFAHSIHSFALGSRPFVKVNCPAVPFDLAESELFGYAKGAFSGALSSGKPGKFEMANNGTIFLDEISSLPLSIQAKLLRVLQERETERLGSTKTEKITFKLIAATNIDLRNLVKEGKFREDLYYRVSKAVIHIPPLIDRKEDIPLYVSHFMEKINRSFKTRVKSISSGAMDTLLNYAWPGNIRELINVLEQAMLKAWNMEEILHEHLPLEMSSHLPGMAERLENRNVAISKGSEGLKREIGEKEKQLIIAAIRDTKGNKIKAAALLGIPRSTLYEKIKKYRIVYHVTVD